MFHIVAELGVLIEWFYIVADLEVFAILEVLIEWFHIVAGLIGAKGVLTILSIESRL